MPVPAYPPQRWNPHRARGENRNVSLPPRLLPESVLMVTDGKISAAKWTRAVRLMLSRTDLVFLVESEDPVKADLHVRHIANGDSMDHIMFGSRVSTQAEADAFARSVWRLRSDNGFVVVSPITEHINLHLTALPQVKWVIADNTGDVSIPAHPDWVRSLRDQCLTAGVAFRFEGWGHWAENIIETSDHERVLHVPPTRDTKHIAVHVSGRTAFTADNPEDPFTCPTYEGWTLLKKVGSRTAGRELDGRVYDEAPLLGRDRIS